MMDNLLPFGFHDDGLPDENIIEYPTQEPFDVNGYVTAGNFDNY
jgi:hypothetical protein